MNSEELPRASSHQLEDKARELAEKTDLIERKARGRTRIAVALATSLALALVWVASGEIVERERGLVRLQEDSKRLAATRDSQLQRVQSQAADARAASARYLAEVEVARRLEDELRQEANVRRARSTPMPHDHLAQEIETTLRESRVGVSFQLFGDDTYRADRATAIALREALNEHTTARQQVADLALQVDGFSNQRDALSQENQQLRGALADRFAEVRSLNTQIDHLDRRTKELEAMLVASAASSSERRKTKPVEWLIRAGIFAAGFAAGSQ